MKRFFLFSFLLILISKIAVLNTGCANIIPPAGGPRDSLPPVLLEADPADSSRNFKDNKITFTFDEFVEVQNVSENLLISPLPKNTPIVDYKLKTVTVKLKDSLEANTTYTFDFGNSIKDFAEGNVTKNFTYTFSTGPYIDSLQLTGNVVLAETGKIDTTLIVMLHTSPDDSVIIKEKPRYITKLDSKGGFTFNNLPPKTYYLYALKDEGGIRRYQSDKNLFAFADKPIQLQDTTAPVTLYAYARPAEKLSNLLTSTGAKPKPGSGAEKRLRYQTNLNNGQQDLLGNFFISFDQPLRTFDTTKIRLYTDSTFIPVEKYSFKKDSTNKKIDLINTLSAGQAGWKENTTYHIIFDKDFAEDSAGRKLLKTDTLSFKTKKLSDYGALKLKLRNLDMAKNPVLLFIQNENIFKSASLTGPDYSNTLFLPGEYELRILYDDNKNGTWDPGKFFGKHQQPEIAKPIERKINVKPGWQNEFEIAL